MSAPVTKVPTTIVTGFLGVGKTTALLDLFRHRPASERWAVLVNEFGEVGVDGAILDQGNGLTVREIPGGCICCSAGVQLQVDLTQLLAEQRPDRLFIEPTGLASPSSIVDLLRRPWFADAIDLRAIITLVDPRRFVLDHAEQPDTWRSQVEIADVLVANKADLADAVTLDAFRAKAAALWPPKHVVAVTQDGVLEAAWLDLKPAPERMAQVPVDPHLDGHHHHHHADEATCGWVFPPETVFAFDALKEALADLVSGCHPALPLGVLRLKGVFHTNRAWVLVQGTSDGLSFEAFVHRRDSRVEIIAPGDPKPDWEAVGAMWAGLVG